MSESVPWGLEEALGGRCCGRCCGEAAPGAPRLAPALPFGLTPAVAPDDGLLWLKRKDAVCAFTGRETGFAEKSRTV